MSTEETKVTEQETTTEPEKEQNAEAKSDDEKSYEELKAEAEAAERSYKEVRGDTKDDEVRSNMIVRRDKALAKAAKFGENRVEKAPQNLDVRDLVTLSKADISEGSEQARILEKYKRGGIIKDFAEGLKHPAIRAEFDVLAAANKTQSVISENDSDETRLRTTKEIVSAYKVSGEVPADPKAREAIVAANLKEMGL